MPNDLQAAPAAQGVLRHGTHAISVWGCHSPCLPSSWCRCAGSTGSAESVALIGHPNSAPEHEIANPCVQLDAQMLER